jgi:hypothetical protein
MGRITYRPNVQSVPKWEDLRSFVAAVISDLLFEINGRLEFGTNIAASGPITVTFSASATPVTVPHGLAKVPVGFLVVDLNGAFTVYSANRTLWDAQQIFLQASGAGTAVVFVI